MRKLGDALDLSASDLVGHLACGRLTQLDLAVAKGQLKRPYRYDPMIDVLRERGARHEREYIEHLQAQGRDVVTIAGVSPDEAAAQLTIEAMRAGAQVIVQAALRGDGFVGRADVLLRIERPSSLGSWSYEVVDTKLARETKGGTILQLSLYSDLVGAAQALVPELMHVVAPWSGFEPQSYRTADYAAYFRKSQLSLRTAVTADGPEAYPEPNPHCDVCDWVATCDARLRADDHLSFIAGIAATQMRELRDRGIETMAALGGLPLPLDFRPERGSASSFERLREQARIQCEGRDAGRTLYELLPLAPGFGLSRLPEPSPGDIFLDFEGDTFVGEGGMEYLVGYVWRNDAGETVYTGDWALSRHDEHAAFERFIDFVTERLARFPDLHIFHYAPYEPAAIKRLMGRYATREGEVDQLLRAGRFVDLYAVVRHALRASVESFSIKRLETLFGYQREVPLQEANRTLARLQTCLELGDPQGISSDDRDSVKGYNRDDCLSTLALRDWLEGLRAAEIGRGATIERPGLPEGAAPESVSAWQARIEPVIAALTAGTPYDPSERDAEQTARWTLAHVLDFHRREEKSLWWEHFRLAELDADDLLYERAALSGLQFEGREGGTDRAPVHRYRFGPQDAELRGGEDLRSLGGASYGKIEAISLEEGWVDIKKRGDTAEMHAEAVYSHTIIRSTVLSEALFRVAKHVADHGLVGDGPYQAARDLILRVGPRIGAAPLQLEGEAASDAAIRIAPLIEGGVLAIQGPPGAGKTHTGAGMISALVEAGAKAGITANSHKVIRNQLDKALETATQHGVSISAVQKVGEKELDCPPLSFTTDNKPFFAQMANGCSLGAGTAWLWAREEAFETLGVLFVDEAAQMSLANVLAVSQAARGLVLLGDPQQLDQPTQGSHPDGTDVSALTHILGGEQTIAEGHGLFLAETWRLHPDICDFTSEVFYEGRLRSRAGLEVQQVRSSGRINGSGLRFLPVDHTGNQSSSIEEVREIESLVADILGSGSTWIDGDGVEEPVSLADILIIAPYNAQVFELQKRLPGAHVGTVDKFQGQQAAIVIYSMATSSHADAPRGMEFLYSLNRLNVATSRAKCVCVLVAAPAVFQAECRTPRQMQLANAFCRYLELSTPIGPKP
jgi:predicted RecB family nuclease